MNQPLHQFFSLDHRRLEELLERAIQDPLAINKDLYHQFRVGLLTHIKMEENILFPAAMKANNNQPIPLAAKLRLYHGAITSMMAVPPTMELIKVLKIILDQHDILEEELGGMYEICERLTKDQTD
ncbi:MAG TPA: hemerythrin domain-containing protein, partial [Flavipsychrobacter sp.]|nr:hemerythrin domain-containing protein [Flavipsychrobacter sp.]